ncbi:HGF [Branchiostoma lanceolatum]|uniref:HGF protein n=1 Tax=Branchiostoma lanceolatum TaxID=7740 RepID=A0A8K0ABP8_BRALA|nr:HGF [Branchiostoma lanceolatum]
MLRVAALALLVLAVAAYPADYRGSVPEKCDGENRLSPGNEYTYNYTVEGYRKPLTEVEDKILWFKWQCSAHIKVYGPCEMVLSTPYCEVLKAVTSDMEEEREYRTFPHGKSYTREFTEDVDLPFYMNLGEVTSVSPKVDGPLHVLNLHRDLLSLLQLPTTLDDLEQITAHRSVHGDCAPKYEITDSVDLSGTSVALGVRMVKDMSKCQHPDNVFQDEVMDETLGDASQQCDYVMSEEGRIDKVTCREQTPDNYLHHNNPFLIANNTRKLVFIKKDPLKVLRSEDAYDKEGRYKDDLIFKIDEPVRPKSPKRKTPSDCKPVRCRMFCKFGWQIDENGCEMCRCNEPGQYLMDKEKCIGRNRFEPGRRYIYNYTVEGKKESPAHMGKTLWLRSTYRVVLDAIDACHAIITTPKCEILNAETSDDSESPQYSSFAQGDQYAKAFTQDYPLIVYWNKGLVEVIAPQVDMPVYILNMRREILSLLQMPIDVPEGREMIRNVYGECRPEFEITDKKVFLNNRVVTGVNVRNELTQCKHPDSSWEEVFGVQLTNATRECKYHLNAKDRIQKVSCKEVMEDASLSYNNPFMIANSRSTLMFLGTRSLPDPVPELSMENRRKTDLVFEMEEQADSQSDVKSEEKDPKVEIITEKIEVVPLPIVKNQKGDPLKRSHVAPFDCEGEKELCQEGNGTSYRGKVSVTESGKTCQRWDSQTPNTHKYTAANYPSAGLEENYCRNVGDWPEVWCLTTDPNTRWERCDVPVCGKNQFKPGNRYLYGYYGKAQGKKSGEQGKDGYWVTARCWVEIEATSKCGFFMKTSNCVFRDSEPRVPGDKVDKEFHKLSANLQENPIYVELNQGLVHRLVVDPSESTHILNTKRAILSTLQMQLEGNPQLQKTITQNDIYGECPVNYVVSEVDDGHVVGMNVTKHVSFCQHPKEEMTHKISQSHSGASQTCRADLTFESVIERVICKDVRPVREDRMIETHRILVLQHVRPLKASEPQYRFDIEEGKETTLTYEAEGEPMDDLEEGAMKENDLKGGVEAKNPCKPVLCKMACEHGFSTDKRGCEICECAKEGEGSCVDDDGITREGSCVDDDGITRKNGDKWRPSFDEN